MSITWEIGTKRGKIGTNVEVFYIKSIGDAPRKVTTKLIADVMPDLYYSPEELHFCRGRASKQSIIFSPGSLARCEVLDAQCTHRAFQLSLNRAERMLDIIFDPKLWSQDMESAQVIVKTNSPNEPICRIPLWVVKQTEEGD